MCATRTERETVARMPREPAREHVAALENGLRALESFDVLNPVLSLSDVARRAGLSRAAARRYLHTLTTLGYAEHDGKRFRLTPRVLRLGYSYLSTSALPGMALPILERVGERLQEVASVAILDRTDVVFLARSAPRRIISALISVGTRIPAFVASTGRVLLAGRTDAEVLDLLERTGPLAKLTPKTRTGSEELLAEIRRVRTQGYALNDEEIEVGMRSISVPVRSGGGVIAAISVSSQSARMTPAHMVEHGLPAIREAAGELEALL